MLSRFGMSFAINISQVEEIKLKFFSQMISMTRMYHKTLNHRYLKFKKSGNQKLRIFHRICNILDIIRIFLEFMQHLLWQNKNFCFVQFTILSFIQKILTKTASSNFRMNFMRRNLSLTTIQREVEWTCLHMVLSEW